jgi:uncharacterized protein
MTAAKAGDIGAQFIIGRMFEHGKGVERNLVKGAEWYQKGLLSWILQNISTLNAFLLPAAESGHVLAQTNLGDMHMNGEGVEVNPVKAVEWYRKGMLSQILQNIYTLNVFLLPAAEVGDTKAQFNLGLAFYKGEGVEANIVKAVEWYQKGTLSQILQKYQHT